MSTPRRPAAFRIEPDAPPPDKTVDRPSVARAPRALDATKAVVTVDPVDIFDAGDLATDTPPPAAPVRRRSWAASIFLGAFGLLVSLAIGLWTDRLIRDLFQRADWLGWLATGMAAVALLALLVILVREALALSRLGSVERLRSRTLDAIARDDPLTARAVVRDLGDFVSSKPETAAGRRALDALKEDIIDGANLIRIAETEILAPLDARAKALILDAAKRVSVVTTVSPRALVDLAYVAFESARLIRRLSELYGGRPGTLGFFRLARSVLAHLAVTGAIAVSDDFVHQVVGQGLAARLSAKLGEGMVNGMMTARIGIAAMEITRPMPFFAVKRPGIGDFLSALTSFVRARGGTQPDA